MCARWDSIRRSGACFICVTGTGLAVAGSGLALGWDWLTAVGITPLIVSVAPCLLMRALGLCMMGRGHCAEQQNLRVADERARAIASICCSPPESCAPLLAARSRNAGNSLSRRCKGTMKAIGRENLNLADV
jgi:hypothetical protein